MKTFKIHYHLYALCVEKNISIRELGRRSGMSHTIINKIDTGNGNPTVHTLCLLSLALGVSPYRLFSMEIID